MASRKPTDADLDALVEWMAHGDEDPTERSFRGGCKKFGLNATETSKALQMGEWPQRYTHARARRGDEIFEKMQSIVNRTISGEVDPAAARVAVDAYKWSSAKMAPKDYGDRVDVTSDGKALTLVVPGSGV